MDKDTDFTAYRWVILSVGCIAVIASFINMTALSPMLEQVAADLGVSMDAATNLLTIFMFSQAVFIFSGGVVADKFGIRVALTLSMLCAGLSSVALLFAGSSYWTVFFLRIVQGAAEGFAFGAIGPIIAMWFPVREQGTASALLIGSLNIGTALGVFIAPVLLEATGSWQKAFAMLSVIAWVNLVFVLVFSGKKAPLVGSAEALTSGAGFERDQQRQLFKKALAMPVTWVGCFIVFFNAWAIFGLYNMAPAYLATSQPMGLGLGSVLAGKLSIALTLFGIAGTICGGLLLDHVTHGNYRLSVVVGFLITGLAGFAILAPVINHSILLLVIFLLLAGFGIPMMDPAVNSFVANRYDQRIVGSMVGLWFGFGSLGAPVILGISSVAVAKTGLLSVSVALSCIATFAGAVLGFSLKMKSTRKEAGGYVAMEKQA